MAKASSQEIYNYLRNKPGVTHEHAMGMIANIQAESAYDSGVRGDFMIADPTGKLKNYDRIVNKKGSGYVYGKKHPTKAGQEVEENLIADIKPSAGGLFQHQGSRFKNMVNAVGKDWKTNWKGQIDFALTEREAKKFLSTDFTSVSDSTKIFMLEFEIPADQSQEKIQSRIDGVANLDLESNYTPGENTPNNTKVKEVTVDDIEAKYGPTARLTVAGGKEVITYTDEDGVFQQIDRDTFFTNDTELTVDEQIQQNNDEEVGLNNEEEVSEDNESFKLGEGKFIKLGEKNYFVFENKNGDVYSIPEQAYLKEKEKFNGGDIDNSPFAKKLPYTLQEVESKVNDKSFGYDKDYSINNLPKVETFDPNSIDLSIPNSNIPDFNRQPDEPINLTEDKDLDNFLKSESDKDKKAKETEEVKVDETEDPVVGNIDGDEADLAQQALDNDSVVGNIDGDAADLAYQNSLNNTGGLPEMNVQKGLLDSIGGIGTIASALVGAKALKAANEPKAEIDMPELSDAFNAELYQQEQLSKRGFSPDQEAAARKQISDSYALGIENAVRGTAGDRAKLLAMSGVLDSQRQAALLDFAAKDDAAMQANKEQFNRTLMFKEKFDINNAQQMRNEKMQEINNRYSTNQQLAASAFKYAMDNVNNAKADKMQNQLTQVMINDASAGYDVKEKYSSGLLGKFASSVLPGLFGNNKNNTETEQ
jgi:hypothetical protein